MKIDETKLNNALMSIKEAEEMVNNGFKSEWDDDIHASFEAFINQYHESSKKVQNVIMILKKQTKSCEKIDARSIKSELANLTYRLKECE